MASNHIKAIISGGGSGGHIFPAIAIANALKQRHPDADILFIGAQGRMEMEKVPAAGYTIEGLPIAGLQRKISLKNILHNIAVPFKLLYSQRKVRKILSQFRPQVVIGVGGYASAPTLRTAEKLKIKTLLQEQNSFPGLTNKMLAGSSNVICVAYDGMEKFFPQEKIVHTGNPVRATIEEMSVTREESFATLELSQQYPVVLSVGGSLGATSMNNMVLHNLSFFKEHQIQIVWQTGKWMYREALSAVKNANIEEWVKVHQFIDRMDMAYTAADVVISRAGAIAISELCLVGKPVILIPSPNVAEDHQTKNAQALSQKGAAILVPDSTCDTEVPKILQELIKDSARRTAMGDAIQQLGKHHAANRIVDEIEKLLQ